MDFNSEDVTLDDILREEDTIEDEFLADFDKLSAIQSFKFVRYSLRIRKSDEQILAANNRQTQYHR